MEYKPGLRDQFLYSFLNILRFSFAKPHKQPTKFILSSAIFNSAKQADCDGLQSACQHWEFYGLSYQAWSKEWFFPGHNGKLITIYLRHPLRIGNSVWLILYDYTQTQYDEGARDGIDIWYMGITCIYVPMIRSVSWLKSPILQSTIESVAWISSRLVLRSANTS